jgi:holo-[acyl-carrier protein] synthase
VRSAWTCWRSSASSGRSPAARARPRGSSRTASARTRRQGPPRPALAARFCAKEAIVKALGLDVFSPRLIEVAGGGSAGVAVRLHGAVAARAAALRVGVEVSLTHTRAMAGAVAVLR